MNALDEQAVARVMAVGSGRANGRAPFPGSGSGLAAELSDAGADLVASGSGRGDRPGFEAPGDAAVSITLLG